MRIFWILMVSVVVLFARSDAIVVGVGSYQQAKIKPLKGVGKDIENIKEILLCLNIKKQNIKILQNQNATLDNLQVAFQKYIDSPKNKKENIFVFYYSGHGMQIVDRSGDERDGFDEASALYDLSIRGDYINGGVLLDDELYTLLTQIKSKKILIFDKCHGDSSYRGVHVTFEKVIKKEFKLSDDFYTQIKSIPKAESALNNFISLSASKDKEAAEDSPLGGLFTQSLYKAIVYKKAIDLNLSELRSFCKNSIDELAIYFQTNYKNAKSIEGNFVPEFRPSNRLGLGIFDIFKLKQSHYIAQTKKRKYLLEDMLDGLVSYDTIAKPKLLNNKKRYKPRESISFDFKSKQSGYLNVLIAYRDSYKLFLKNRKITTKKYTFADTLSPKTLRAKKPFGITKIYLILSREPWDIQRDIKELKSDDFSLAQNFTKELIPSAEFELIKKKNQTEVKVIDIPQNIITISKVEFDVAK